MLGSFAEPHVRQGGIRADPNRPSLREVVVPGEMHIEHRRRCAVVRGTKSTPVEYCDAIDDRPAARQIDADDSTGDENRARVSRRVDLRGDT